MDKSCLKNQWMMPPNFFFCIFTLITLLLISAKPALALANNETDRLALLAFKKQLLGGSSGSALSSWNTSLHFCEWEGVRCGRRHQRVISLNLSSLNLVGSISPSIGNLSFLREVNLSNNRLQGNIPMELGHLKQLRSIILYLNNLQGKIPEELSNCSNLQEIRLAKNNLTGEIPFHLGDLKNLIVLLLSYNNLIGGIPSSLGNLSSLNVLNLYGNKLEGIIPNALGRLSNLGELYINENSLSGSISPIYNLSSSIIIHATNNQLTGGLPPEIDVVFPNIEEIAFGRNKLTGTIPRSISNISSLQLFDLAVNGFSGSVPDNIGKLRNLQELIIDYNHLGSGKPGDLDFLSSLTNCSLLELLAININRFGGVFPNSIANLSTRLHSLYMGDNQIAGKIPEGIGNLVDLNVLEIQMNLLVGEIPISTTNLQNLEGLYLGGNRITGKIPSSIGNLSRLSLLDLSANNFEGSIPLSIRNCKNLQQLDLSQNKLNDSISYQLFGAFENLFSLKLSHNSFSGLLPSDLGNLKNLVDLYVDNNNFFGEIPNTLGESLGLTILFMHKNSFQGNIPQSFASLRSLENLDISYNNLTGTIPPELQKLPFLVSFNLSFNQLEGEVPKRGVFKNVSGFSFYGNKRLCGGVPEIELPKCFSGKVFSTKVIIAMILSILLGSILAVFLVYLSWRRKPGRGLIPIALFGDGYLRISYKDLLEATQGFASSNLIGCGSFGFVYKAVLHQQEKPVAVKVLNLQNHGAARSFMAECKALRKVRHRNLLKIITSCSSIDYQGNDFKALVFEFMPNGSLESWLHEKSGSRYLNLVKRLDIAIDVGNAIDYLHHYCQTLIVHCDLKPTNVLLDDDMVAHVSDFGLAKLLSSDTNNIGFDQTSSSMIKGTIGYIPPEYGMGGAVSPKGDIYSYGILLLEMITEKRPTDDLLHDGLSLHNFCKMALPEGLKEILDFRLVKEIGENRQRLRSRPNMEGEIWECLVSFTKIGVACSAEVASERMGIKDAIKELQATKSRLLPTGIY
ncbi:hypothetical protein REPUB_Repub13aG0095600 [Reevesia pubescens]